MDRRVSFEDSPHFDRGRPPAPPEAQLDMPAQNVDAPRVVVPGETDGKWRFQIITVFALALTGFAALEAFWALSGDGMSPVEWLILVLLVMNFCWLTTAATTALFGSTLLLFDKHKPHPRRAFPMRRKTVILYPMYNEAAAKVMGGAEGIYDALVERGLGDNFEFFFLSDTTDRRLARIEEDMIHDIARRRPGQPFFYRRRLRNTGRKAGNVEDFVTRWGGRYDYMVVCDADSIMSPEALMELVKRMDADPKLALIQTVPVIVKARTFYARMQQFSMRTYGPIFGSGLNWWSGGAGNFWGHNAIIHVKAFASSAALPVLPGKAPLGGPILSHDFVEGALLRRNGWRINIAHDIDGSYEECPPTMVDLAQRDRRWAQGNIQQISLLKAKGFDWISRVHITAGVMGYMSAALWYGVTLLGFLLAVQTKLFPPLKPDGLNSSNWDLWDANAASNLLIFTLVIVWSPKWLSLLLWACKKMPGWTSRDWRFPVALVIETVSSTITAPIMMFSAAVSVVTTFFGSDNSWRPQVRDRNGFAIADLVRLYAPHMATGATLILGAFFIAPSTIPSVVPLGFVLFAAPVIVMLQSLKVPDGGLHSVTRIPEEVVVPPVLVAADQAIARYDDNGPGDSDAPPPPRRRRRERQRSFRPIWAQAERLRADNRVVIAYRPGP